MFGNFAIYMIFYIFHNTDIFNETNSNSFHSHVIENHYQGKIYRCNKCPRVFKTQKLLKCHGFVHTPLNIPCEICGATYKFKAGLRKHRRVKHPELNKKAAEEKKEAGKLQQETKEMEHDQICDIENEILKEIC
jgi:hypothetical protein